MSFDDDFSAIVTRATRSALENLVAEALDPNNPDHRLIYDPSVCGGNNNVQYGHAVAVGAVSGHSADLLDFI